jgi:uracil-DNA glycosylase
MGDVHPADGASSLADLARRLASCRLCDAAGEPVFSSPIASVRAGQRALIVGQAPGIHEPALGKPFAADAGRRLRRWFAPYGLEAEDAFRATFAMSAVMKCFPGRDPGGRGDRRPLPGQLARCAPWTAAQRRLLQPAVIVPVGALAIESLLGRMRLTEAVGQRFERDGRPVIPLPHPSGASAWLNLAGNRALVERAVELVARELGRV